MWRLCDLHRHTWPNEQFTDEWNPQDFVESCVKDGLHVIAVTDHDIIDHVPDVITASTASGLEVIPGIEISTDRGHILAVAPEDNGIKALEELIQRVGILVAEDTSFADLVASVHTGVRVDGSRFSDAIVLIGAHVDANGSLLATPQQKGIAGQLEDAKQLHALEVISEARLTEWQIGGVKQSKDSLTLIRGSDAHGPSGHEKRATWLWLPEINVRSLKHALATPECSVITSGAPPNESFSINSVSIVGGLHDGRTFHFSPRANAVLGAPSSGKSLLIDSLRFLFRDESDLADVRKASESRLSSQLGTGGTVSAVLRVDGKDVEIERTLGGTTTNDLPFRPIFFGQTELTRRAMEDRPSMALLDVHCPEAGSLKGRLADITVEASAAFELALSKAVEARSLVVELENPQDGLEATKSAIGELAGSEGAAKLSNDIARVTFWRKAATESVEEWRNAIPVPAMPDLPESPSFQTDEIPAELIPTQAIAASYENFSAGVESLAATFGQEVGVLLASQDAAVEALQQKGRDEMQATGHAEPAEVTRRLGQLRERLTDLERTDGKLAAIEKAIRAQSEVIDGLIDEALGLKHELRKIRKVACSSLNPSLRTFFARLRFDSRAEKLDSLLESVKTGTNLRASTILAVRDSLDRKRLIQYAIEYAEGRIIGSGDVTHTENQDRITAEAVDRKKFAELAAIATTWPGDSLDLRQKASPKSGFELLTEGLRALGIKEISFASSRLPVITDQPEDAVPTRAVFDSLVPTLRHQRKERQFIVASHDANIVVAADMERVLVIDADEDYPVSGSLFDEPIREYALELLEGGEQAFQLRNQRYKGSI